MFTSQVAKEVGSRLGAVEEVEQRRGQDELHYFMRVRVALPISKPIRRGSFIVGSDEEKHWVKFRYERLPLFCHYCGMLGHDVKNCAEHFAVTKNGGMVDYQYGEFLKNMGGRARSGPFERKAEGLNTVQRGVVKHPVLVGIGRREIRSGVKRCCNIVELWRQMKDSAESLETMMNANPDFQESRHTVRNVITPMQVSW